jgi:hypothetical protein
MLFAATVRGKRRACGHAQKDLDRHHKEGIETNEDKQHSQSPTAYLRMLPTDGAQKIVNGLACARFRDVNARNELGDDLGR